MSFSGFKKLKKPEHQQKLRRVSQTYQTQHPSASFVTQSRPSLFQTQYPNPSVVSQPVRSIYEVTSVQPAESSPSVNPDSNNTTMAETEIARCPKASEAALERLSKLMGDTSMSDFTIICGDREWKVHRFVLTLHSNVLQAACTHGFKEEKDRVIDLSDEDADGIGAFVFYLYHLNYDAALFREAGDHLSLHVQMCVLGDKYDVRPLQDLAVEKFKKHTEDSPPTGDDLANAAICAYDAIGATTEIRKIIVKLAIDNKLIPSDISSEPSTNFERAIQNCPGLCLDIVKVQQGMITPQPKSYNCPALCGTACSHQITVATSSSLFRCYRCNRDYYGWQWGQYAVL